MCGSIIASMYGTTFSVTVNHPLGILAFRFVCLLQQKKGGEDTKLFRVLQNACIMADIVGPHVHCHDQRWNGLCSISAAPPCVNTWCVVSWRPVTESRMSHTGSVRAKERKEKKRTWSGAKMDRSSLGEHHIRLGGPFTAKTKKNTKNPIV